MRASVGFSTSCSSRSCACHSAFWRLSHWYTYDLLNLSGWFGGNGNKNAWLPPRRICTFQIDDRCHKGYLMRIHDWSLTILISFDIELKWNDYCWVDCRYTLSCVLLSSSSCLAKFLDGACWKQNTWADLILVTILLIMNGAGIRWSNIWKRVLCNKENFYYEWRWEFYLAWFVDYNSSIFSGSFNTIPSR